MTKTAILFPGQGAQKVGMGADFLERSTAARGLFDRANDVLGYDLKSIVFSGPEETLTLTKHCQPAIYVTSAAIIAALEAEGIVRRADITAVAGLSLGEYTALYYAGVFSFEDGLRLVSKRGTFMQDASDHPPSGMVSLLGAELSQAEEIARSARCDDVLCVANILSPGQIVLSGAKSALERVPAVAREKGIRRTIPLTVAGAFHSPLMEPAARRLAPDLEAVPMKPPSVPVYGNVTGRAMSTVDEIRSALAAQVVHPVQWEPSMRAMLASGITSFIEPGPGKVLAGLLKKIDPQATTKNFDTVAEIATSS